MSAVLALRLAPAPHSRRKTRKPACCNQAHAFATAEIALRDGCQCGTHCRGEGVCVGQIVRRLRPVPGGFAEAPL
jgi:hypothetical protein